MVGKMKHIVTYFTGMSHKAIRDNAKACDDRVLTIKRANAVRIDKDRISYWKRVTVYRTPI